MPSLNWPDARASAATAAVRTMAIADAKFFEIADAYWIVAPMSRPPTALQRTTVQTRGVNLASSPRSVEQAGRAGTVQSAVSSESWSWRGQNAPVPLFFPLRIFSK